MSDVRELWQKDGRLMVNEKSHFWLWGLQTTVDVSHFGRYRLLNSPTSNFTQATKIAS